MKTTRSNAFALSFALALAAAATPACSAGPTSEGDADDLVVSPVDFYASSAKEYWVSGAVSLQLEDTYRGKPAADRKQRALALVSLKNVQVSWFLSQYLVEKEHDDGNAGYGGFNALARFDSNEAEDLAETGELTYRYTFKVQVAGGKNLLAKIPGTAAAGGKTFDLAIGKVSNDDLARLEMNHEWYRSAPWSGFDPSKVTAEQKETIRVAITPQTESKDAYLAMDRLFSDGELSIAVHFGHDYHARYDITGSRRLYETLLNKGFVSPVSSYAKYLRDSGPLTKRITANGKPVDVKIWIFHPADPAQSVPGPDPDTDAGGKQLEADMRESFKSREVVIFEGHSGPLYGFALANWKKTDEGDMDDSKIPGMEMPRDKYQVVLANGCDTYALGNSFWMNPAKSDRKNLNVFTTTSFSNAATEASATRLIEALIAQSGGRASSPLVSSLVTGMDQDQGWSFDTMYGVHGVDGNPKADPLANKTTLCKACTTDASCGGDGNKCVKLSTRGAKACTFGCVDDTACPTGYTCRALTGAGATARTKQCVPTSLRCN